MPLIMYNSEGYIPSKYGPNEILNSNFLPLMKKSSREEAKLRCSVPPSCILCFSGRKLKRSNRIPAPSEIIYADF